MKKLIIAVTVWPLTELYYMIPGRFDFPFLVTVLMAIIWLMEVDMENLEFDFSAPLPEETDEVKKAPGIHYAKLANSPRLQRLHALLQSGKEYTTLEIMQSAKICAVSSAICELRLNGIDIPPAKMVGRGVYSYKLNLQGEASC